MTIEYALLLIDRIARYCSDLNLGHFNICLHGGEPTLWPLAHFDRFLSYASEVQASHGLHFSLSLQTNGYAISKPLIRLLDHYGVSIGISLDGPIDLHDSVRRTRGGGATYQQIIASVDQILDQGYPEHLMGFLAVAHPQIKPADFLAWANELPVRRLDLLWPMEFNHDHPPWWKAGLQNYIASPTYGVWFADVFTEWFRKDDPSLLIRTFVEAVSLMIDRSQPHGDDLVNDGLPLFVVNTDGRYEYHDYLRGIADGACNSGMNLSQHSLDTFASGPVMSRYLQLNSMLPAICRICPDVDICGGGFLPGRMSARNLPFPIGPSVMCFDQSYYLQRVRSLVFRRTGDEAPSIYILPPTFSAQVFDET